MKTIVIDIDGVLLDWKANLPFYMLQMGMSHKLNPLWRSINDADVSALFVNTVPSELGKLIGAYTEHEAAKYMPEYPDAFSTLEKLSRTHRIVALSKFGWNRTAWINRVHNLNALYPGKFEQVICIEFHEKKSQYMQDISNTHDIEYFIDDSKDNIDDIEEHYPEIKCIHVNRSTGNLNAFAEAIQSFSTNP